MKRDSLNKRGTLLLCLFVLTIITLTRPFVVKASGENWLSGYGYRKKITINNSTGAGINYQINVTIHNGTGSDSGYDIFLGGNCTDFPNDIRFTDNDGDTELDHWGYPLNGTTQRFWIEIADNLDSSNVDIYIYYSRNGASSGANGDNTFLFFDHFIGSSLNLTKWDVITGSPSVANSEVTLIGDDIRSDNYFSSGIRLKTMAKSNNWNLSHSRPNELINFTATQYSIFWGITPVFRMQSYNGGATFTDIPSPSLNVYHTFEQNWVSGAINYYWDETLRATHNTNIPTVEMRTALRSIGSNPTVIIDWIFIGKFVDPEPDLNSVGSVEEYGNDPENISCIITNIEVGNNVYPPNTYYVFQATTRDNDTDLHNMTVAFTDGVSWGNFTFHVDTDTWTRDDGIDIIVLNSTACTNSTSGNYTIANFHIRFREEILEASLVDIYMRSIDALGREDTFEIVNNNYFNIVLGIELIEYSSGTMLFFLCIFVLLLSLVGMKWGLVGWTGFILACAILIPNILDPSGNPILHPLMYWTIFISFALNLLSTGIRFKDR